eukprot:TRINITY_DN3502_c0_g1_i1.p1 TRINITY_DN3502_c0_g1~~TRINITY_DN3502_c0_g1_i1.p1  ORF type:complete len:229 (+),score=49.29 TRINITY_DN3502_c0_g1_i1:66-752(+)
MTTIATENKKLGQEIHAQQERLRQVHLSGEQEEIRQREAQDVLKQLQVVLREGEVPGTEAMNDVLLKTEQFLVKQAQQTTVDPQTRKTLEDIALLVGSAKQLARHKDLGDRLKRIGDETTKALQEVKDPKASPSTIQSTQHTLQLVSNLRPLFDLMFYSSEFRYLIRDTINITRTVLSRHDKGTTEEAKQQFLSGAPPREVAQTVKQGIQSSLQNTQGEVNYVEDRNM